MLTKGNHNELYTKTRIFETPTTGGEKSADTRRLSTMFCISKVNEHKAPYFFGTDETRTNVPILMRLLCGEDSDEKGKRSSVRCGRVGQEMVVSRFSFLL